MNKMIEIELNEPIWIIGDVHGEYHLLMELILKLPKDAKICFVGDLIDRGNKSKEVIKFIRDNNHYAVKGNHEEMMEDSVKMNSYYGWFENGGLNAVRSYIDIPREIYEKGFYKNEEFNKIIHSSKELINDIEWIKELPYIIKFKIEKEKPLYVSHSGLKLFDTDKEIITENKESDIIWNRLKQKEVDFAINIHGHTPIAKEGANISKSQINVDTGACFGSGHKGLGHLTAINYPSLERVYSKTYSQLFES